MSYLAIQIIQIQYTDDQRGRVDAEKRELLRALPLAPIAGDGVLHDCRANGWENFEPRTTTAPIPLRDSEVQVADALKLRIDNAVLVFIHDAGAEVWKSKPFLRVPEGQWARVLWNTKRSSHDSKWLVEYVLNAGLFPAPPGGDVFLATPVSEHDLRRDFLTNAQR
ncbi:MAG TPA: hypothetical protein VMJ10_27330 [Kofleriaceae bacterium]|nr:hypothetical protein [Kofleriaceae bacterium]